MLIELALMLALTQEGTTNTPKTKKPIPATKVVVKPETPLEVVIGKEFVKDLTNADTEFKLAEAEYKLAIRDLKDAQAAVERNKATAVAARDRKEKLLKDEMIRLGVAEADIKLYSGTTDPKTGSLVLKRKKD